MRWATVMSRARQYLNRPATTREVVVLIGGVFFLDIAFSLVAVTAVFFLDLLPEVEPEYLAFPIPVAIIAHGISAFWEEIVLRIVPLTVALRRWGTESPTIIVVCVSSVIFGIMHGGPLHLLAQGVGGILYSVLFIKLSHLGRRPIFAGLILILVHFSFNVLGFAVVMMMS